MYLCQILTLGIIFSTAFGEAAVVKPVIWGISPSMSVTLAL